MFRPQILLLLPALFVLAFVTLYPLLYVVWLSLHREMLIFGISDFVGLENYRHMLSDARFWSALWNTLYFSGVSVLLELTLGMAAALLLQSAFRGRGFFRALILLPWVIPSVVGARMWEWIANSDYGVLNYLIGHSVNWLGNPLLALHAAIAVDVWRSTPFVALLLLAALQGVPADLYRAAAVDGAGSWRTFRSIVFPSILAPVLVVFVLRVLDAVRVFDTIYVLTGGGPAGTTETLSLYAYRLLFQTLQFGYGSAVSVSVCILVGMIALAAAGLLRRVEG
jgi:multiple sugar transport system permease protein